MVQKFKEKRRFVSMVSKFGLSKSTIVFKIPLGKLTAILKQKSHYHLLTILKNI